MSDYFDSIAENKQDDWSVLRFKETAEKISDRDHFTPTYVSNGIPIISPKDFDSNERIQFGKCKFITLEAHEKNRKKTDLETDDIVFTRIGAGLGKSCLVTKEMPEFSILHSAAMIRVQKEKVKPKYFLYYLKSELLQRQIGVEIQSIGVPDLGLDKINDFKILLPPSDQQQKIAKILTTIDQLIEKTQALIDKHTAIKQGMMTGFFAQGIDLATGQLRPPVEQALHLYKETELGWVPKDWRVESIRDRIEITYGKSQIEVRDKEGSVPVYGTGGLMEYANTSLFNKDSILIGRKGTLNNPYFVKAPFWVVDTAYYVSEFKDGDILFLSQFLSCFNFMKLNESTGVPSLNRETIYREKLAFPPLNEQLEITKRLNSVDNILKENNIYLEKVKMKKNGLMQDLLTGKRKI